MGHMPGLAKVSHGIIAMLRFPGVVAVPWPLLQHVGLREWPCTFHSSEQGTLPTASLTSKQAVLYRTRGNTCFPRGSTPMNRSLADSSMTNHKSWRSQPSPPFQILLKPQHRTSSRSLHITMDGRPTLLAVNTSQTQHHKDENTCTTTQDCRAKQYC
jgi:hypothetical protein